MSENVHDVGGGGGAVACEKETSEISDDFENDDPPGVVDLDLSVGILGNLFDLRFG